LKDQGDGSYLIIGASTDADTLSLKQRVGEGESLIRISGGLLEGALLGSRLQSILHYGAAMLIGASMTWLYPFFLLLPRLFR
jgi:hypothetical protein